jgi:hypothetical protein
MRTCDLSLDSRAPYHPRKKWGIKGQKKRSDKARKFGNPNNSNIKIRWKVKKSGRK